MTTTEEVVVMQGELAEMGPQLETAIEESVAAMEQIATDTKVAEATKVVRWTTMLTAMHD